MTTATSLHRVKAVTAGRSRSTRWLQIEDDEGNHVTIFMKAHEAEAMADAWESAQTGPDPRRAEGDIANEEPGT